MPDQEPGTPDTMVAAFCGWFRRLPSEPDARRVALHHRAAFANGVLLGSLLAAVSWAVRFVDVEPESLVYRWSILWVIPMATGVLLRGYVWNRQRASGPLVSQDKPDRNGWSRFSLASADGMILASAITAVLWAIQFLDHGWEDLVFGWSSAWAFPLAWAMAVRFGIIPAVRRKGG